MADPVQNRLTTHRLAPEGTNLVHDTPTLALGKTTGYDFGMTGLSVHGLSLPPPDE